MDKYNQINQGRVPTFNGSENKYSMWWEKFTTFTLINCLSDVIQTEPGPYMPESCDAKINANTKEGRKQIRLKRMNDVEMSCFTMAFMKERIMRLVSKSKTKEWHDGLACLVLLRKLNKKYKPRDIFSCVKMRQRLNQIQMKRGSDPSILF
jgi:hypothetical protein